MSPPDSATVSATEASASVSAARRRKLHPGHFAFMRAILQGVPSASAWERYLPTEGSSADKRLVRSTVGWIRDEFVAASRRHHRHGTARLVQLDVARLSGRAPVLPTLAAFAEAQGLEDESEFDQVAAFEVAFGRRSLVLRRQGRLLELQLDALRWLQQLIAQPPQGDDSVVAWLDPHLAMRLEAAGVLTLFDLIERINGIGKRWFVGIKALGEVKAGRIAAWCREHQATIGLAVGEHVSQRRTQLFSHELSAVVAPSSKQVRPLEKFVVPASLDGSSGLYRRPQGQCLLIATTDHQAIFAWLNSKSGLTAAQKAEKGARRRHRALGVDEPSAGGLGSLSNTQRTYRKEAERFLLWAILQRGKALSSMTNEDCVAYRDFLADPRPAARWCGVRSRERWSPLWRPFESGLSSSAQHQAVKILRNLYAFLVDRNYLMGNPWSSVRVLVDAPSMASVSRSLSMPQWRYAREQLVALPPTSANERLKFGLPLLYSTGLRLSEVIAASVDDLQIVEYPADSRDVSAARGWLLSVRGEGSRKRQVAVPSEVVRELGRYLSHRGLVTDPLAPTNRGARLLGVATDIAQQAAQLAPDVPENPRKGIAAGTFYEQVKGFFAHCAAALMAQGDAQGARHFAKASTHWMRHSHAVHAIAGGMPVEIAQLNLGHASLTTTTAYVAPAGHERLRAIEKFWAAASVG